jgi:hypothetical protein
VDEAKAFIIHFDLFEVLFHSLLDWYGVIPEMTSDSAALKRESSTFKVRYRSSFDDFVDASTRSGKYRAAHFADLRHGGFLEILDTQESGTLFRHIWYRIDQQLLLLFPRICHEAAESANDLEQAMLCAVDFRE